MGASQSAAAAFSSREKVTLKRMFKHLAALSPDRKSMDKHTFLKLFEREWQVDGTAASPMPTSGPLIAERMFAFFDKDGSGTIDMSEWLVALSRFMRGSDEDFLHVIFEIYDLDGKEAISRDEFRLLICHLPEQTLEMAKQQLRQHNPSRSRGNSLTVVLNTDQPLLSPREPGSVARASSADGYSPATPTSRRYDAAAEEEDDAARAVVSELIDVAFSPMYDTDRSGVLPFEQFRLFLQHAPALCDVIRAAVPWQQLQAGGSDAGAMASQSSWVPSVDADRVVESPRDALATGASTTDSPCHDAAASLRTGAHVFGRHHPSGTSGTVWKLGRVTGRWVRRFAWTWGNLLYYWEAARSSPLVNPQIRESPKGIIFMPEHVARAVGVDDGVSKTARDKGMFGFVVETRRRQWEDPDHIAATKKRVWYVETEASRDAWVAALRSAARLRSIGDKYDVDMTPDGLLGSGATAVVRRCSRNAASALDSSSPRATTVPLSLAAGDDARTPAGTQPQRGLRGGPKSKAKTSLRFGGSDSDTTSLVGGTPMRAASTDPPKQLAVKIFRKESQGALAGDRRGAFERLRVEISVLKLLRHPHILPLLDWFEDEENVYVVTPLVDRGELFTQLVGQERRTELQAYHVIRPILSAVAFMHSKGVAHRDLKMENILVGAGGAEAGDIIIADLGLSRILSKPEDGEAGMHYMCGSSGYVAPEVIRSATDATGRALFTSKPAAGYGLKVDVWSVGVILHTLVYGSRPMEGPPAEMVRYLVSDNAADDVAAKIPQGVLDESSGIDVDRIWAKQSPALRAMLFKMLQKNPEKRISASEALVHAWITEQRAAALRVAEAADAAEVVGVADAAEMTDAVEGTPDAADAEVAAEVKVEVGVVEVKVKVAEAGGGAAAEGGADVDVDVGADVAATAEAGAGVDTDADARADAGADADDTEPDADADAALKTEVGKQLVGS